MITLSMTVNVPEDRRVTLTLPPEVPVGAAELQVRVERSAKPDDGPSDDPKFNREWKAFHDMLPELLQRHRGQYVAIHEGKVVGSGMDSVAVSLEAHKSFGDVTILVREVSEAPRVIRLMSPRIVRPAKEME